MPHISIQINTVTVSLLLFRRGKAVNSTDLLSLQMTRLLRWSECQCQRVPGSTIAGAAAAVEAARPVRQAVLLASRGIVHRTCWMGTDQHREICCCKSQWMPQISM